MGFLESLGKLMAAPFQAQAAATAENHNWTLEQIEEMERQGCDMTEIRKKREEKIAAKEAREAQIRDNSLAVLDMEKLAPYFATPRDPESDFVKDAIAVNHIPKKRAATMPDAPLVYASVVQAHYSLYEPGEDEITAAVFCFAMDEKHMHDTVWLRELAGKISAMKKSDDVPADNRKFINTLRDDQSRFCFKLGPSLCGDADAWCATHLFEYRNQALPLGYIPATRIVPMLVQEGPEHDHVNIEFVAPKYYTK